MTQTGDTGREGRTATSAEVIAGHDLSGKHAVVTGGYSGIGYETVRALASAGAWVTVAGRDAGKGAAAVTELQDQTGNGRIVFSRLDLSSLAAVREWTSGFVACGTPLQLLINNAGVMRRRGNEPGRGSSLIWLSTTWPTSH